MRERQRERKKQRKKEKNSAAAKIMKVFAFLIAVIIETIFATPIAFKELVVVPAGESVVIRLRGYDPAIKNVREIIYTRFQLHRL